MSPEHLKTSSALVLFSVIVALIPSIQTSSLPISGWYERDPQDDDRENAQQLSSSFLAVRQVHVSLTRLCRVLEREELRCRYVAVQSAHLYKIDAEFKAMKDKIKNANIPNSANPAPELGTRRHRRQRTFGSIGGATIVTEMAMDRENESVRDEQTKERQQVDQEVVDLMLAAKVEGSQIHGNLARELLQVFHAMSRTNESTAPTPSAMVSARDSTVFINRHLAVPIESVNAPSFLDTSQQTVRPYHTMLFPQAPGEDLVDKFSSGNSYMKQLLCKLHPSKSLSDVALEGAMPLQSVMEMANYLMRNGICSVSHVLRKHTLLACSRDGISKMNELSLQFSQLFQQLSIHGIVSVLTMGCRLEEVIERLILGDGFDAGIVGGTLGNLIQVVKQSRDEEQIRQDAQVENNSDVVQEVGLVNPLNADVKENDSDSPFIAAVSSLEDYILRMVTWLAAHKIVVPKQEYLIAGNFKFDSKGSSAHSATLDADHSRFNADGMAYVFEEALYKELVDEKALNGKLSTAALCFRYGIDERTIKRLRVWGLHSAKIRSIFRVPNTGDDDWGTAYLL